MQILEKLAKPALGNLPIAIFYVSILSILPLFGEVLSLSLISLITLRRGLQTGALLGLGTLLVHFLITKLTGLYADQETLFLIWSIIPADLYSAFMIIFMTFLAAAILRVSISLNFTLQVFSILIGLLIPIVYQVTHTGLFRPEILQHYQPAFKQVLDLYAQQAQNLPPEQRQLAQQLSNMKDLYIPLLNIMIDYLMIISILLFSRFWQASLFKPGGFGAEFRELKLNYFTIVLILVLKFGYLFKLISAYNPVPFSMNLVLNFIQIIFGLSLVQWVIHEFKWKKIWLLIVYLLTIVISPVLALLSLVDGILDLRKRLSKKIANKKDNPKNDPKL